jgi:amino acid permease
VTSDVLKGYPQVGIVQVTRLLFSLLAVFSYPLQAHPSRTSCLSLWSLACGSPRTAGRQVALAGSAGNNAGARAWLSESQRFRIATVVGLFGSYLVAVTVTDLSAVLGVVGATGSTMVSYILPGLCYTQTFKAPHLKRNLAWLQLGAGCVIMPACLTLEFFK